MTETLVQQTQESKRNLVTASQGSTNIGFTGAADFALTLRVADCLSRSELVPDSYRGEKGFPNCVVALELSSRLGISWMAVMQNLYVVYGRPAWMSSFLIANVNGCGRFHSLRFDLEGAGEQRSCTAWTCERSVKIPPNIRTLAQAKAADLPVLEGTTITWRMAKDEGWTTKKASKWLTMADQMFRYRAAAFWSRVYAPELTMGIRTMEEIEDLPTLTTDERTEFIRAKLTNGTAGTAGDTPHTNGGESPGAEEQGSGKQFKDDPPVEFEHAGRSTLWAKSALAKEGIDGPTIEAIRGQCEQAAEKFGPQWLAKLNPDFEAAWKRVADGE